MRSVPESPDLYRCAYCGENARRARYGWLKCKVCRQPVCTMHMDDHLDAQHGIRDMFTTVAKDR